MRPVGLVAVFLIACVRTSAVPCGDGTVCAPGTVCNEEHGQCLTPDQLVSCVGKANEELCPIGTETGVCRDELCPAVICGDGLVQGIEQCDSAPPQTSCFDLGYDVGFLGCNDAVCAVDLPACHRIGWKTDLSVHGVSANDVFAMGASGTLAHFDGQRWSPLRQRLVAGKTVWTGSSCTYFATAAIPWSVGRLRRGETW